MGEPSDPGRTAQSRMSYIADMLSQLAEMARSDGQLGVAVAIRLAAVQASRAESAPPPHPAA